MIIEYNNTLIPFNDIPIGHLFNRNGNLYVKTSPFYDDIPQIMGNAVIIGDMPKYISEFEFFAPNELVAPVKKISIDI